MDLNVKYIKTMIILGKKKTEENLQDIEQGEESLDMIH